MSQFRSYPITLAAGAPAKVIPAAGKSFFVASLTPGTAPVQIRAGAVDFAYYREGQGQIIQAGFTSLEIKAPLSQYAGAAITLTLLVGEVGFVSQESIQHPAPTVLVPGGLVNLAGGTGFSVSPDKLYALSNGGPVFGQAVRQRQFVITNQDANNSLYIYPFNPFSNAGQVVLFGCVLPASTWSIETTDWLYVFNPNVAAVSLVTGQICTLLPNSA